jgi:hypothetical protein
LPWRSSRKHWKVTTLVFLTLDIIKSDGIYGAEDTTRLQGEY